ncbi:aryl hydrocarbon receptor-like isoform X2 [Mobula birostris]|uniref:aryl hydrocarbon receptor-like isoform X2 n=1 Tax=Mobula birostris TaxID=1983395 RepID=UPI003B280289
MLNSTLYAVRKRKRPTQKMKPDVVKSNSSKRHRAGMNTELEQLAEVLPFPKKVINKLDKLSVLRLSVSFLRAKCYFEVALQSQMTSSAEAPRDRSVSTTTKSPQVPACGIPEGAFMLQALNGFVLVVAADGMIFYASQTIQDYLGFHQSDVINQSVFKLIHTEDREKFRHQLRRSCRSSSSTTGEGEKAKERVWFWAGQSRSYRCTQVTSSFTPKICFTVLRTT